MEDLIKNKVFLFSVILNFSLLVFAITSCSETQKERLFRETEIGARLNAEEKLDKFMKERQGVQEDIDSLRKQLEEEKINHDLTRKALLQERVVSQGLKEELNKVTKTAEKPQEP